MTVDEYRHILSTKQCPKCNRQLQATEMGMYGDSYGWIVDGEPFRYTLYARCGGCNTQTSFRDLGIMESSVTAPEQIH